MSKMQIEGTDYVIVVLEKLNPNGKCKGCNFEKFEGRHGFCASCQNRVEKRIPMSEYLQLIK